MSFHQYDITELYSNADGEIQFIELTVGNFNGESFWQGLQLTVTQGGTVHRFTFPFDLPSSATAGTSVLVATEGFADLGIVRPDFIVPSGFLFTTGSALVDFAGVDTVNYPNLPTDGVLSLDRNQVPGVNSPTNFARETGSVAAPPIGEVDGSPDDDELPGTFGRDHIEGFAGDDLMAGLAGDDELHGGDGLDTAFFSGPREAYTVGTAAGTVNGPDGADTLTGIERLVFDDLALAFDADGSAGQAAKLLSAVFGSSFVHDPVYVGVGVYLLDSGQSYEAVAELALHALLGDKPSHEEVVTVLYTNVVGSAPDGITTQAFVELIDSGLFTQVSLTTFAADHPLNLAQVDLAGIAALGIDYLPFS